MLGFCIHFENNVKKISCLSPSPSEIFYPISRKENSGIRTEMKHAMLKMVYIVCLCFFGSPASPKTTGICDGLFFNWRLIAIL